MEETKFIGEPITAEFDTPPSLEKKPGCPARFAWGEERFTIVEILQEWHDYQRRGRMALNMRPEHAEHAAAGGSWGWVVTITGFVSPLDASLTSIMTVRRKAQPSAKVVGIYIGRLLVKGRCRAYI